MHQIQSAHRAAGDDSALDWAWFTYKHLHLTSGPVGYFQPKAACVMVYVCANGAKAVLSALYAGLDQDVIARTRLKSIQMTEVMSTIMNTSTNYKSSMGYLSVI